MTSRIRAIQACRPRVQMGLTVQTRELVDYIANRTGYNTGDVVHMLAEFHDAIVRYVRSV